MFVILNYLIVCFRSRNSLSPSRRGGDYELRVRPHHGLAADCQCRRMRI